MRVVVSVLTLPNSLIFLELPDLRLKQLLSRIIINLVIFAALPWNVNRKIAVVV